MACEIQIYEGKHYKVIAQIYRYRVEFIIRIKHSAPSVGTWSTGYRETKQKWPFRDKQSIKDAALIIVKRAQQADKEYEETLVLLKHTTNEITMICDIEEIVATL